jgi:hypothetical protein
MAQKILTLNEYEIKALLEVLSEDLMDVLSLDRKSQAPIRAVIRKLKALEK